MVRRKDRYYCSSSKSAIVSAASSSSRSLILRSAATEGSPPQNNKSGGLLATRLTGWSRCSIRCDLLLVLEIRQRERFLLLGAQQLLEGGGRGGLLFLHVDVAIGRHTGARRDEAADDDVLLEPAQVVDSARDCRLRQYPRGLLERGCRDERLRRQRGLGDAQQQRRSISRLAAAVHDLLVLLHEAEAIDLLVHQEIGVANPRHSNRAQHLTADDLDVLVVDGHRLRAIDLLDLVDQVPLQLLDAQDREDVVRIDGTIDERIARPHTLPFLHVDVHRSRHRILVARALVGLHDDAAHALDHRAVMHGPVDLGDDGLVARMPRFEQLHHPRKTAGDVLGLGGGARNLGDDVARINLHAVLHHQVRAGGQQILALVAGLPGLDRDGGRTLLGRRRFHDDHLREAGDAIGLFADVLPFDDVLEHDLAADFREDGRGERIPLDQGLSGVDVLSVVHLQRRAVHQRVTLLLARRGSDLVPTLFLRGWKAPLSTESFGENDRRYLLRTSITRINAPFLRSWISYFPFVTFRIIVTRSRCAK